MNLLDLSGIKFNKCSNKSMGSENMTDQRTKRLSDQPTDQPTDGHEGSLGSFNKENIDEKVPYENLCSIGLQYSRPCKILNHGGCHEN